MENQDKTTFSLDDNPNDEIVEEEVIDRDEEYEVDDDDDYDEEYDEEEDYDDEEDYDEEEDYDDGYSDDYYDDRLNKVLDEIADLKRGMQAPSTVVQQQQPPFPSMPQYIYTPSAPAAGSEVVMYNEISRLRDELAKNQSSLEMQKELSRIKEDMARDQKFSEAQYSAEIKRLQDKIDELLKNAQSPQNEQLPAPQAQEQPRLEGGKTSLDFDKLLSINESILRAMREGDSRIQNDIAQLKKQVEEFPSADELERAVSAVKKAAHGSDGVSSDLLEKLSGEIASLKTALQSAGIEPTNTVVPVFIREGSGDISASELLRQLYDIKNAIGSASSVAVKRSQEMGDLINDFKKVNFDVHSQAVPFKDKLSSVSAYAKKLSECEEQDAIDLIRATNSVIEELAQVVVTREAYNDLVAFVSETGGAPVPAIVRDSVDRFFTLSEKLKEASVDEAGDYLPDILAEKNIIQNNAKAEENNAVFTEITDAMLQSPRDDEAVAAEIARFASLTAGELVELPIIEEPKAYKASHVIDDSSIFTKLAEIKAAILDSVAADQKQESDEESVQAEQDDFAAQSEGAQAEASADMQAVFDAIDALEQKLSESTGAEGFADALEELRNNYLDISDKLIDISERLANAPVADGEARYAEPAAAADTTFVDETNAKTAEDLEFIKSKLDEHEVFLAQIGDLRNDVLNLTPVDYTEQFSSLVTEIAAQCDKLYEDISNALIDSETNILNKLNEPSPVADAVAEARDAILADTQAIRDSVVLINDNISHLPLGDAMEQLRSDILNLSDQTAINADAAMADRQRILDDIAFLREQAEAAIAEQADEDELDPEARAAEEQERDKLYGYLDDIAAKLDLLVAVPEDVVTTRDSVATLLDVVTPISDSVFAVSDNVNRVAEDVAAVRSTANATLDALAPITDQLNSIIDRLDRETVVEGDEYVRDEVQSDVVSEDLTELKEDLNTILDTLPLLPQSDDLVTARDNTYSILDTLTMMPQSDDVVMTRDNVAAVLDAVNALTETVQGIADGNSGGTLADDVAVIRDTLAQSQDDVQYIRQKLDESDSEAVGDSLTNIMQDLGLVLDKLEALEQTATVNKQDIVDTVSGIREEIHINELDETISAAGIDDETRETLVGEISEIRERLNNIEATTQSINDVNATALDNIANQLAELQAAVADLPAQSAAVAQDGGAPVVADDSLQAIIDELAVIKEKIDAESDYDTVEEILTLRDDVKAARIVDQNEVSSELEAIKNELASISSGNILDEIRALRDDISAISGVQSGDEAPAPTTDELNLVLNEIVSLRDEVFAFKDEVMGATNSVAEDGSEQVDEAAPNEDINNILDELTDLREAQSALTDTIEELKDVISRRTTIASDGENAEATAAASGELNIVLDEIINLKNDIDQINERIPAESIDALTQQVSELHGMIDGLVVGGQAGDVVVDDAPLAEIRDRLDSMALNTASVDLAALADRVEHISNAVDDLRIQRETEVLDSNGDVAASGAIGESLQALRADLEDVKAAVSGYAPHDMGGELAELRAELDNLRAENEALRQAQNDAVASELAELREAVRDMALSMTPAQTENGDTSYAALIDEIKDLKNQVYAAQTATTATLDEDTLKAIRDALAGAATEAPLAEELADIRDEIAQLRSLTTVTAESGGSAEISALRNELASIRDTLASPEHMYGLAEDVTAIKADVQVLKEEPDLGVINEILALRDEFQSLREQIEDVKRIAGETDKQSDDTILGEVQSLRDQLFAISMANVNDASSGETNYESYNNLILDEIAALNDRIDAAGSSEELKTVTDEIAALKATLEKREELYDALAKRVEKLNSDATNNKILEELASLRTELANQRDADLTTLNFMSEMAHLLERQNSYIAQNTGSKISDEIESLKAELAASDSVAEEVAKLREIMSQSGSASDNETILNELADLREELSSEKPSRENELILQEIARLRDEITALTDGDRRSVVAGKGGANEGVSNDELADSLSDLKSQLNEIAGIVEPEKKPAPRKKSTSGAKKSTGAKKPASGAKKSTGAKKPAAKRTTQKKATAAPTPTVTDTTPADDEKAFEAKIESEVAVMGGDANSLDPNATAPVPTTSDTMDVADRLAQQVANKLVIEQLVEQLGGEGMSEEEVDEILRELPQELTTKALDDQSDRVRKLANQLVLNKLRQRLGGKSEDKDQ